MKAILLPALLSLALSTTLPAQTCREVVRDASGRIVQTIDRQKNAGGTAQAATRDASGRITGTASTRNPGCSAPGANSRMSAWRGCRVTRERNSSSSTWTARCPT